MLFELIWVYQTAPRPEGSTERLGTTLGIVARTLLAGEVLDLIHRDHRLLGNYLGRRECHIESDWLLVYKLEEYQIIFERMGTHSDLFG